MFNKSDKKRNMFQLYGNQSKCGYDWWWHSFTAINEITKEEKPFFIEFYLCNPSLAEDKPVFGQLEENKNNNIKPSYLMIKVGTWCKNKKQIHSFYSWNEVEIGKGVPYYIKTKDCYVTEDRTYGKASLDKEECLNHPEYMCDYGNIEWELKIDKKIAFNVGYGASSIFRKLQLFEMFWHAEGMKTLYEGYIILDGEKYIVSKETSYGYADKNWGKDFTSPWVWLSSNNLTSKITGKKLENSVFNIGGGRPKIGAIALERKLLSAFYYEGKCYEFNFSKFWTNTKTKFNCYETEKEIIWEVEQTTWNNKMITNITCNKDDMILVNYESPNGDKKHNKLWNGGNGKGTIKLYHKNKLVDEIECLNIGCEYGEFDK
ncbi:MAG: hypothetical protein HUJ68_00395 [Clostridia bacterium]|nr:hypothetical protein [Clostridia bacterium]